MQYFVLIWKEVGYARVLFQPAPPFRILTKNKSNLQSKGFAVLIPSLRVFSAFVALLRLLFRFYALIGLVFVWTWVLALMLENLIPGMKQNLLPGLLTIVVTSQLLIDMQLKSFEIHRAKVSTRPPNYSPREA